MLYRWLVFIARNIITQVKTIGHILGISIYEDQILIILMLLYNDSSFFIIRNQNESTLKEMIENYIAISLNINDQGKEVHVESSEIEVLTTIK